MKRTLSFLLFLSVTIISTSLSAQAPNGINYQAVIRTTTGTLASNQPVVIRARILQTTANGTAVYSERHNLTTDQFGLVNFVIGNGVFLAGNPFANLNWGNGPYFLELGVAFTNQVNPVVYMPYGTQQMMSVPYALYAKSSGNLLNQWSYGANAPAAASGNIGDYYLDTSTGNVYSKLNNTTWVLITNITGPQGLTGLTGPAGVAGPQGPQGPAGLLTSGSVAGNTPYWNGSQWVVNGTNFYNNGSNLGVGTTSPHASALTDMTSTTQGFLPPRMTTVQRNAIASPAVGLTIYNTTVNCLQWWNGTVWYDGCGNNAPPAAVLSTINCAGATTTGTLTSGTAANGVSTAISYTGGNAGTYSAQNVASTGVTGLTAALAAGTLANGAGSVTYTITGTPASAGTASFAIALGGQSCSFTVSVAAAQPQYPANTVNCNGVGTVVNDVTNPTTGRTWMDRNLGASQVATSSIDQNAYGDLYQWGRRADGHQCRTSPTTATLSSVDQPAHGNFILAPNPPYDWRSPQNTNLWQGVNGVNNPCPSGYRLPTVIELNNERLSWASNNSSGAFAAPLKWTLAGIRYHSVGSVSGVGTWGCYWSSTVSGTYSRKLVFDSVGATTTDDNRALGFPVRCIKN
jgi:hypothetical protein